MDFLRQINHGGKGATPENPDEDFGDIPHFLLITHEGVWREKTERSTTKILDFAHGKCIAGGTGEPCFSPVKLQGLHSEECF